MVSDFTKRIALLHLAEDEGEEQTYQDWVAEQPVSEVSNAISNSVIIRVKSKLGPLALPFLSLYEQTRAMLDGAPAPDGGLVEAWKMATKSLTRTLATKLGDRSGPELINSIYDRMSTIRPLLRKIENGFGVQSYRSAGEQLASIIADVCRSVEVPVSIRPGIDAAKWPLLRRANPKEQAMEELRIENPNLYSQIIENRAQLQEREVALRESISRSGLLATKTKIRGRVVNIGVDPKTNERMVFTNDGRVLGVKQFSDECVATRDAETRSLRVFPNGLPKDSKGKLSLDGVRSLSPTELQDPAIVPPGQTLSYAALTDDLSAEEGMRIYPTMKDAKGRPVVVAGRFQGVYMDDLVNRAGRLIEGAAYDFDGNGKRIKFETKNADGSPNLTVRKEPYVTVLSDGRFMVKIPYKGGADPYKPMRQAMEQIGKPTIIPTIEKVEGTQSTTFTFHAKDFVAVREKVGGMVMSKAAATVLKAYYDQLSKQERALTDTATENFSLARIGGFRVREKIDPATGAPSDPPEYEPDLFRKQKQAISWVESRGYSGMIALDTGIGKTLTCIATMQKMERDGFAADGSRFLYVCPTKLRGNFTREARAFLVDAGAFLSRVDIVSYDLFAKRLKENANYGSITGDLVAGIPPYSAVFFDEAQILVKNEKSKASIAAQKLKHPRKILLTASPMEESPDELYVGVAIANNIDLNEREEKGTVSPAKRDMTRFRSRFCQQVGGRTIGLRPSDKSDPTKTHDFYVWAKANFFAANKRDVIENPLPALRQEIVAVQMDPEVERVYRETAKKSAKVLGAAFAVYRDKVKARSEDLKALFGLSMRKQLSRLNDLANMPDLIVPGARSPKVEASVDIVRGRISNGVRTLLFTDTPKFATYVATELSKKVPSLLHGVALSGEIAVFQNGAKVKKYTERGYVGKDGREIPKAEWASFVLREILGGDPSVASLTLTSTYTLGQNLQMFSTVVHLDRDTFSSEMMKQRTARSWRTGQDSAVDEIVLDVAYANAKDDSDETLDELRKEIQGAQENLFNEIVGKSQSAAIGKEWSSMANVDASLVAVNRKLLERVLAPFPSFMGSQEAR